MPVARRRSLPEGRPRSRRGTCCAARIRKGRDDHLGQDRRDPAAYSGEGRTRLTALGVSMTKPILLATVLGLFAGAVPARADDPVPVPVPPTGTAPVAPSPVVSVPTYE